MVTTLVRKRNTKMSLVVWYSMEPSRKLKREIPKQEMYFPIDVMTNILNRLPSASISRFQSVSKYWYYVIHVSVILNARSKSSLMSVELSTNEDSGKLTFYNFDGECKTEKSVHKINLGCTMHYKFSNMVNGLVCAYGNKATITFYLINLSTLKTSKCLKRKLGGTALSYDNITLGFDPSTGLYKFIRIYSRFMDDSYHCEILETGVLFNGNWKSIGKIPHKVDLDNPVFLNGAIHWARKFQPLKKGKPHAFHFLKFDMKEEKFKRVTPILKNEFDDCDHTVCKAYNHFTLTEENGKLYVLHYCCKRQCLDGWRLNESKYYSAWNDVFHVNFASILDKEQHCLIGKDEHPYVVGIVDGKVLIRRRRYDEGVYIYDLLHKKLSKHWDIYCGSFSSDRENRRMLFYHVE